MLSTFVFLPFYFNYIAFLKSLPILSEQHPNWSQLPGYTLLGFGGSTNLTAGPYSCLTCFTGMSPVTITVPYGLTLLLKPFSRP